jgi:mono/diheme cytochrome c family protein
MSAILGLIFLGLANASVFLMFKLWGYPFDEETHTSAAPRSLMRLHRLIGYAYAILYVFMMWHMVPRLWNYQVELPPRTVAHLMLGITIGVLILVKIAILRFFRHFEESMPYIGTCLLICTYLLIGLSVPFTFREAALRTQTNAFSEKGIARTRKLLANAGLSTEAPLDELASKRKLREGQRVLQRKCVVCHDLRTILVKPRTPTDWVRLVNRMAIKPMIGEPIHEEEEWTVSAYLIAITPDIQTSVRQQRQEQMRADEAREAAQIATVAMEAEAATETTLITYNEAEAKALFEDKCSQCHPFTDVEDYPPRSEEETTELITRMIEIGLYLEEEEIELIARYINENYLESE